MTLKYVRELHKLIEDIGLVIVDQQVTGASQLKMMLEAPNGVHRTFFVSRHGGDWRAIKNTEASLRRFADTNRPVATAPAQQPTPITAVAAAFERAASAIDAMTQAIPIPPGECTAPDCDCEPGHCFQRSPATFRPTPKPQHLEQQPTMNTNTTTSTDNTTGEDKREINRLSQDDYFRLCMWVTANVPDGADMTYTEIARKACEALTLNVTLDAARRAVTVTGKKLVERKRAAVPHDRAHAIAVALRNLMRKLGEEVPDVIDAICERRGTEA